MKLITKKLIGIFIFLLISSFSAMNGQNADRTIGLSATLQGAQYGISVPIWLGQKFVLAPEISYQSAESLATDLSFGLNFKFYSNVGKFSPYGGFEVGLSSYSYSDNSTIKSSSTTDYMFGLDIGGEYFFDKNFSVGIEAQGNLTKSDKNSNRYGNPGNLNFNTATMIYATIYF